MKIDIQKKIFHDCQLIKQMECEMKTKIKLLTHLFGTLDDAWKVVGITENALNKLESIGKVKINKELSITDFIIEFGNEEC